MAVAIVPPAQACVIPFDDSDAVYPAASSIGEAFELIAFHPSLWPDHTGFWLDLTFYMEKQKAVRAIYMDYKRGNWLTAHMLHWGRETSRMTTFALREPVQAVDFNFLAKLLDAYLGLNLRFVLADVEGTREFGLYDELVQAQISERIRHLTNLKRILRDDDWAIRHCGVHTTTHEILGIEWVR